MNTVKTVTVTTLSEALDWIRDNGQTIGHCIYTFKDEDAIYIQSVMLGGKTEPFAQELIGAVKAIQCRMGAPSNGGQPHAH